MIYELSSITETAAPLSGCSRVVIRNAETYFTQKLRDIFSSIAETCGSTPPQVVMSDVSGSYVCPDGKVWDQVTYQCLIPGKYHHHQHECIVAISLLSLVDNFYALKSN
jgi:hypothetical protein